LTGRRSWCSLHAEMAASLLLSLLAFVAAYALAARAKMDGRCERLLASVVIWLVITQVPTNALAWANRLYPGRLAISVVVLSLVAIGLSAIGRRPIEHARTVLSDLASLARLPYDGFVDLARAKSVVFVGALFCALMVLWSAWLSYLAPPAGWDGLWYHDPILSFAMQNHGFRMVEISDEHWPVNSFPRIIETLGLWFVAFGDRRLVELPSSLFAVPLFVGVYVLAKRYIDERSYAIGCACAILLVPGMYLILRSTYIDLVMASFYVMALHFATRPVLRMRDTWLAATMLGFLFGSKIMAFGTVPVIAVVLLVRGLFHFARRRPAATAATLVGATAWMIAIGAPSYIRNWVSFGSPMWPWGLDLPALHIHWPGRSQPVVQGVPGEPASFAETLLSTPVPGKAWPDTREHGYGMGVLVLMLPLGCLSLVVALLKTVSRRLERVDVNDRAGNLLYTVLPALTWLPFSPNLAMARYNIHVVIVLVVATAWLLSKGAWLRAREGIVGAVVFMSLVLMYWATPGWGISLATAKDLMRMTTLERACAHVQDFLPEPKTCAAREQELKPGDVVVFGDGILFPALLWNERYSNRAVWVPSALGADAMLKRADELGAKWFVASSHSAEQHALKSRPAWQEVGQLSTTSPAMIAFRRVGK
jgi:hypothetical protein